MEFLGFLFELVFLIIGLYGYLLLTNRIKLKGSAEQNFRVFKQNVGSSLTLPALILAILAAISLFLHIAQFIKKWQIHPHKLLILMTLWQ